MSHEESGLLAALMLAILVGYESVLFGLQRWRPQRLARTAHASLRQAWFRAVSQQPGTEILAVQTLRNSMMSATMTASTAALALMATVTLSAPTLHSSLSSSAAAPSAWPVRLALELLLIALLFVSLVASTMAVRYYNHAGYISAMPVGSNARVHWAPAGEAYVRRAGLLYSAGLRYLILVAPVLACILHPMAGPPAAVVVVVALWGFDRFSEVQHPTEPTRSKPTP
jgi:hypothetical protein